jgi:hypothetical protein
MPLDLRRRLSEPHSFPHEEGTATAPLDWAGFSYIGIGLPLEVLGLTNRGSDGTPKPLRGGPISVLGTGWAVVATTTFAFIGPDLSPVLVQALLFLLGTGTGMASTPLVISAFTTVPRGRTRDRTCAGQRPRSMW